MIFFAVYDTWYDLAIPTEPIGAFLVVVNFTVLAVVKLGLFHSA